MKSLGDDLYGRLCVAIGKSRRALQFPRERRNYMARLIAGNHWTDEVHDAVPSRVPLNMMSAYASIVGRKLIANNPRVMLSTNVRAAKPAVATMQAVLNDRVQRMRLDTTIGMTVLDALMGVGFTKVALATPSDAAVKGWGLAAGTAFAARVDLDDMAWSLNARSWEDVEYMAHRYRVPLDTVKDSKLYSKARKDLRASQNQLHNETGDERIDVMGRTYYSQYEADVEDWVDLWEVYLPRHKVVLTLAADDVLNPTTSGTDYRVQALREQKWIGPDGGPYHPLCYLNVPGNLLPKGPMMDLIDLHIAINNLYNKLINQAERQKGLMGYQSGNEEDMQRVINAKDGEAVRVDNPQSMKAVDMGGPNQANFQLATHLVDRFSYLAGNLEMLGGLSPQSKTATQDKLLAAGATGGIQSMQAKTVDHTASVATALAWYEWHHPTKTHEAPYTVPGVPGVGVTRKLTPDTRRQIPWDDLRLSVDPYSLQHKSPEEQNAKIDAVMTTIVMPMQQLLQQQGVFVDLNALLQKKAELMDLPELPDIVSMQEPPPEPADTSGNRGSDMPIKTERNYTRESRSAGTQDAKNQEAMMAMGEASANREQSF